MKLTAMILLVTCLHLSARSLSQSVTLQAENRSLKEILNEVKDQTGYSVFYRKGVLDQSRPVTLHVRNMPLAEFLDLMLKDQPLKYELSFRTITLFPKPVVNTPVLVTPPEETPVFREITGTVTGEKNMPLADASVRIRGKNTGVQTDAQGRFTIQAEPGQTLIISYIGYLDKQIRVPAKESVLHISLQLADAAMDAITINKGYYTEKKALSAGNVSTVKAEDIARQPVSNPLSALQGRVPGLVITQSTGVPGSSFNIQLRGKNSISRVSNAVNDPLIIVDGVPYPAKLVMNINSGDLTNGGSPLNFINPQDIEAIDVLKDADATAIYGSRASNGVILITTKKGKAGKLQIMANVVQGSGKATRRAKLLNTRQYLDMRYEAYKNDKLDYTIPPGSYYANDLLKMDTTRNADWQKEFLGGSSSYTDAQVSVSGGTAATQYLVNGSFHRETSVFPGTASDRRGTMYFNINSSSQDQKFRLQLSGGYTAGVSDMPRYDLTDFALNMVPVAPTLYNPDGSLNWANGYWQNPIARFRNKFSRKANNFIGNAIVSYQILPGLEARATFGYTHTQTNEMSNFPSSAYNPSTSILGQAEFSNANNTTWLAEPQLTFSRDLWKGHLNALAGTTIQQSDADGQDVLGTGYVSDGLLGNLASAGSVTPMKSTVSSYKYNSLFGRFNYVLMEKYIINLTARRDGSDRFGPNNRFGNFGAIGAAWIFSREKLIADALPFLSFGKIRGSYGVTGSDAIGTSMFIRTYSSGGYPYQGVRGLAPNNLFNPDYRWESNKKLEGGLELGFLRDKLTATASYFRNRSGNQLVATKVPGITGFASVVANWPALVQNQGWEFTINLNNIHLGPVTWNSYFNFSRYTNKLVDYPNIKNTQDAQIYTIGQPIDVKKVFHSRGVDSATGVYVFQDSSGKVVMTPRDPLDRIAYVKVNPEFYGGIQNNFSYKGFELDFLFQFVRQMGTLYRGPFNPGIGYIMQGNQPVDVLNRWQKPGDKGPYQKFSTTYLPSENTFSQSDAAYTDASFIRLKNVQLSYDLMRVIRKKTALQQMRVYIQAQNLWTITSYRGVDPENQSGGSMAPLRVITGGLRIAL